jgi:hypothetical protein
MDVQAMVQDWQKFYKKVFNLDLDLSKVRIPEHQEGIDRLLIITNITLEELYAKCKELFPCWKTDKDLDGIVTWNERDSKDGPYAIWIRDVQEADEELKNLSANDIKKKGITTETLAERFIHELKFYDETGKHLDIKSITLCMGSRYDDGFVPLIRWYIDGLGVRRYPPANAYSSLRARQAVSS